MKEVIIKAPANIAFIKYWGNSTSGLPLNNSISMNLSACQTITKASLNDKNEDEIFVEEENGEKIKLEKKSIKDIKAYEQIERIKNLVNFKGSVLITSKNTFPSKAGIASSASGFCALTSAVVLLTGQTELFNNKKELSKLVRLSGSASAARSVLDGFVELKTGESEDDSYSVQIAPHNYWELCDIIAVVSPHSKKTPSSEGHNLASSSPYLKTRIIEMQSRIKIVREAILNKDIEKLGIATEQDTISMHAVMMTSFPPVFYFNAGTMDIINNIHELRRKGLELYFSIDAGANVHLICEKNNAVQVEKFLKSNKFVEKIIINFPGKGAFAI